MEVLFCFDEKYEQHFGVAVTSLILNNSDHLKTIYIVTKKTSNSFNQKIAQIKAKTKVDFVIFSIEDQDIQKLKISAHISTAAYYRLLAPNLLPKELNKVLYLDSDLIVNGSILDLYNSDISNYILAACGGKVITTKQRLELQNDYYFNSGVMLINLEAWHKMNIGQKCIQFIQEKPQMVICHDQDALNKVIDGNFLNLDQKWNSLVNLYAGDSQMNDESVIVHFIGSLKPWQIWCIRSEKEIYWSYLKQSPWSHISPEIPKNAKELVSATKSIFKQLQTSVSYQFH